MAAKQPQDRKIPKNQPKTVEAMGVTVTVSPAIFDDLDMVEYLYDLKPRRKAMAPARSPSSPSSRSCAATSTRP